MFSCWRAPPANPDAGRTNSRALKDALGSPELAWLSFQTLWDDLLAEQSDFLD